MEIYKIRAFLYPIKEDITGMYAILMDTYIFERSLFDEVNKWWDALDKEEQNKLKQIWNNS